MSSTKTSKKIRGASTSLRETEWGLFLEFCNRHALTTWWFRGLTNANYKLVPKVGRDFEGKKWSASVRPSRKTTFAHREFRIFKAFRRRARLGLQFLPETDFEWLALAQHHGVPTRLLDWTTNPLMAAWFAMNHPNPEDDQIARIYAVHVTAKLTVDEDDVNPFRLKGSRPAFVVSPHWHPRVRAQRGCFSIHPTPNEPWKLTGVKNECFDIESKYWPYFRRRLFYFGIDASTVMADLSGLGEAKARANRGSIQYLVPINLVAASQKSGPERNSTGDPR
jgi:hypothetical protein